MVWEPHKYVLESAPGKAVSGTSHWIETQEKLAWECLGISQEALKCVAGDGLTFSACCHHDPHLLKAMNQLMNKLKI